MVFVFSLSVVSMSSMVSSEILSSISFILLAMLVSMTPDLFPRFSISRVAYLLFLFNVFISLFRFWMLLFNSFTCLLVFSDVSLRASTCISLRELFMWYLRSSSINRTNGFKSKTWFSGVLGYSVLAVVGDLGSDVARLSWFLFLRFLCLLLAILLSLILVDLVSDCSLLSCSS